MKICSVICRLTISSILLVQSGFAFSATVNISFTADITSITAAIFGESPTSDESWIDTVNNTIFVGEQLTGTLTYHTDPSQSNPGSGIYIYSDPLAYISFTIPSAGLSWSSSINAGLPLRLAFNNNDASLDDLADLRAFGQGSEETVPDFLYRDNYDAYQDLFFELSISERFPDNEIPLTPINMDNFIEGSGYIVMSENLEDDLLGDYFGVEFNITNVNTTITSVPLPASLWLAISGFLILLRFTKRKIR